MVEPVVRRRGAAAGVRFVLAGHEHNFQHSVVDGVHHLVSGAGGKLRPEPADGFDDAHTASWASRAHLLVVDVDPDRAVISPVCEVADDGTLVCIDAIDPAGHAAAMPISVPLVPGDAAGPAG